VTWRLIARYESFARDLRVLTWTNPTPGLPYIAALGANRAATAAAVTQAIDALAPQDRATLGLKGLTALPAQAYLAVPNPPDGI
jgi:ABC-type phosphate/phosphonate transport system substrate-binding protein